MDLRDVQVSDLRGFDAVMHLAALSNDPLGDVNPQCTYDINHLGSVRLARLAKEAGGPASHLRIIVQPLRGCRR